MTYADFLIEPEILHEHLNDADWRVVDCRFELKKPDKGRAEYLAGHIPGAVYAHLDRDLAGPVTPRSGRHPLPAADDFAATLGRWGISGNTTVVAYDQGSGAIAARLWWMLRWLGHRRVLVLDGGFEAWRRAGLPIDAEAPVIEPARFTGRPDERMVVTTDELQRSLAAGADVLVDAREAARFTGRVEPIDAVAGHVPGAVNFPFGTSLRDDGRWRSAAELECAWSTVLGGDQERSWITMCGSGVTACHLAISARLAGYREPRLYVGSFSEWIRDPRRPVAGVADGP
jgi:thiosulfate/3-mercaptopyruvate sulfurtransferase